MLMAFMVSTHNNVTAKNYIHKLFHYASHAIYMFLNIMLFHVSF